MVLCGLGDEQENPVVLGNLNSLSYTGRFPRLKGYCVQSIRNDVDRGIIKQRALPYFIGKPPGRGDDLKPTFINRGLVGARLSLPDRA
jgi:hypothetical protein